MTSTTYEGRPNTGPIDFYHLLKRRRVEFSRWADQEGIKNQEEFQAWKTSIEAKGEFYLSEEFLVASQSLPAREVPPEPVAAIKEEPVETPVKLLGEEAEAKHEFLVISVDSKVSGKKRNKQT